MRAKRRAALCIVVLLLALPVAAEPAEGGESWWAWLAEGWAARVVRMLAGSEEPPPTEEPETTAAPAPEDDALLVCLPGAGCVEVDDDGGPHIDPDG